MIRTCNLRLCLCHFARLHRPNSWVPPSSALHTVLTDTLATTWFTTIMPVTTPATKSGSACTTNPKDDLTHLVLSHRPLVGKGPLTIHPTTEKREVAGYTGDGRIQVRRSDTREAVGYAGGDRIHVRWSDTGEAVAYTGGGRIHGRGPDTREMVGYR